MKNIRKKWQKNELTSSYKQHANCEIPATFGNPEAMHVASRACVACESAAKRVGKRSMWVGFKGKRIAHAEE